MSTYQQQWRVIALRKELARTRKFLAYVLIVGAVLCVHAMLFLP